MVSPAAGWEDTEWGYEAGTTAIAVLPVDAAGHATADDPAAWRVDLQEGDTHDAVLVFPDARRAWELANLLTHYVGYWSARDLRHDVRPAAHGPPQPRTPGDRVEEGVSARDALESLLGDRRYKLADAVERETRRARP